jgi:hypothetical protein
MKEILLMKKLAFIFTLLLCFEISLAVCSNITPRTISITKETLTNYCKDFDMFLDQKRKEKDKLASLPNGNTIFGWAANFFIENVIAPLFTQYGEVNIEEAKIFLGRSFEYENMLKQAINILPSNMDSIAYIDAIFAQAEGDILAKKDGAGFLKIIKQTKYTKVPNPKCMGNKTEKGEYVICSKDFYDYSVATLMAFHIFENHVKMAPRSKRKNSKVTDKEEAT